MYALLILVILKTLIVLKIKTVLSSDFCLSVGLFKLF